MALSTKAIPGSIRDFEDFADRALNYDFYTDMSDDHRVYQSGRRAQEIMDNYAKENPLAQKLWDKVRSMNADQFMAGQLINRVNDVVLDKEVGSYGKPPMQDLKEFMIGYLASSAYTNTMLCRSIRDDISKLIPGMPYKWGEDSDKRDDMIDAWIDDWKNNDSG